MRKLDHPPPEGNRNVIYSSADKIKKRDKSQLKVQQIKLKTSVEKIADGCSKGEQSHNENKRCQAENSEKSVMQPVKPKGDMRLKKPAAKDKNCQVNVGYTKQKKCEYDYFKSQFQDIMTRNVKKKEIMLCGQ